MSNPSTRSATGLALFFENFSVARVRFTLETETELILSEFNGQTLRGGLGHTLKALACAQPAQCRPYCRQGNRCAYGYIFETSPPDDSQVLSNLGDVPRPYVLQPPAEGRTHLAAGETFAFDLTLIGRGVDYLPLFIAVFERLGKVGLGHNRGRYRLRRIEAVNPYTGAGGVIMQDGVEADRPVVLSLSLAEIKARINSLAADQVSLTFLTPTRLKAQQQWVDSGPPFQVLIRSVLSRLSSLSYFHCGHRLELDFKAVIDRAGAIKIARCQTEWASRTRFSGRQKQGISLGGLTGQITYSGELTLFLPFLVLGELTHLGKGAVFGNGQYRIEQGA